MWCMSHYNEFQNAFEICKILTCIIAYTSVYPYVSFLYVDADWFKR